MRPVLQKNASKLFPNNPRIGIHHLHQNSEHVFATVVAFMYVAIPLGGAVRAMSERCRKLKRLPISYNLSSAFYFAISCLQLLESLFHIVAVMLTCNVGLF